MSATTTNDNQGATSQNLPRGSGFELFPTNIEPTARGQFWEAVYYAAGELVLFLILAVYTGAVQLSAPILSTARTLSLDFEQVLRIFFFSSSYFRQPLSSLLDPFRLGAVLLVYGAALFILTIPIVANLASRRPDPETSFRVGMKGVCALLVVWGLVGVFVGVMG